MQTRASNVPTSSESLVKKWRQTFEVTPDGIIFFLSLFPFFLVSTAAAVARAVKCRFRLAWNQRDGIYRESIL